MNRQSSWLTSVTSGLISKSGAPSLQLPQDRQRPVDLSERLSDCVALDSVWVGTESAGGPLRQLVCWRHELAGVPGDKAFECAGCAADRESAVSRARTRFIGIVAALNEE